MKAAAQDNDWGEFTTEALVEFVLARAPSSSLFRHPFLRKVYLILFVFFSLCFLLPFWTLSELPRSRRPRSTWSLERCLRVRWSRHLCALIARCEIDYLGRDLSVDMDPTALKHSHPVTIPPAPQHLLLGHPSRSLDTVRESDWMPPLIPPRTAWRWTKNPLELNFTAVKAFWYVGEKQTPDEELGPRPPNAPVMLHFHGGGYLCGTAAETDLTSSIPKALVQHSAVHHILSIDYRLAPQAPWPIPLLDAISAYKYLVDEGVEDIVIAGDSAGGHLALALIRWLQDERALPLPKAAVLLSPWCDIGFSNSWGTEEYAFNARSDTIDDTFGPFATSLLLRGLPPNTMHLSPYLSPASLLLDHVSFDLFPPMFIVFGGAERLGLSTKVLWERLRRSRLSKDYLLEMPDAVHDFMIFPWQAEEAALVYERLDEWLRDILSDDNEPAPTLFQRRRQRRASLKWERSPVMRPIRRESGVFDILGDFHEEGRSLMSIDSLSLPSAASAKDWLTPFTAQAEKGDWDWDGAWYDDED